MEDTEQPMIFDHMFCAWRSPATGHRVRNVDGSPVRQTRTLPPVYWLIELLHRWEARRAGKAIERLKSAFSAAEHYYLTTLDTWLDE